MRTTAFALLAFALTWASTVSPAAAAAPYGNAWGGTVYVAPGYAAPGYGYAAPAYSRAAYAPQLYATPAYLAPVVAPAPVTGLGYTAADRAAIRSMPIEQRPYRFGHVYGNTVRRLNRGF